MGYRSDAALSTTAEGFELFTMECDRLNAAKGVATPLAGTGVGYACSIESGGCVYVAWRGQEWYEARPEVEAVMEAIAELDGRGVPYRFARVGEEYDDIEILEPKLARGGLDVIPEVAVSIVPWKPKEGGELEAGFRLDRDSANVPEATCDRKGLLLLSNALACDPSTAEIAERIRSLCQS